MTTTVITTDSLELMVQLHQVAKDLIGAVDALKTEVADIRLATIQPALLDEHEAAIYIGMAESTLRLYRMEGQVGDRTPAPEYVKVGDKGKSSVRYEKAELDRWIREELPRFGGRKRRKAAAA